jgi:DsbC/DsbD-like thiol-disulfide interchange protein/cytochrome c biogenesis protein CcdA
MRVRSWRRCLWAGALALAAVSASGEARAEQPPIPVPDGARASAAPDAVKSRIELRLLVDPTPAPGRVARVGVLFTLDPGWHLYWRNPGEAGLPTKLAFEVDGGQIGPIAWPAPEVIRDADAGLTSYGYTGSVLLASDLVRLPEGGATRQLRAAADFLICKDQCIPGEVELTRDLDQALGESSGEKLARTHALFEVFAARVPQSAAALGVDVGVDGIQRPARAGEPVRARLSVRGALASASFIPESSHASVRSDASAGSGGVTLAVEGDARLSGVLELRGQDGGVRFVALDLPLEPEAVEAPAGGATSLATALALALLGGLVLNLMPCVLPVLALKVFGLAELGGRSRREVAAHAFGYMAGIEVTLLVLAAAVIALRAAGTYVGWGFQFQEPRFALAISLVLVGFALNLFGVFEIGAPTSLAGVGEQASGWRRSFFDGLLAVVLATPCSAPFLGTAVGFAFAGSAASIVLIFAAIGLGLAAPIAAVALVPATARFMPRSGPWMAKLRSGLGFALLASACWTLWIFGRSAGVDALAGALALLVALGAAVWVYGLYQAADRGGRGLLLACAIALAALVALRPLWRAPSPEPVAATPGGDAEASWQRFDPDAIAAELRGGRPVFVDFTATWCLTCAVNERTVIASAPVKEELAKRGYALFRADWTRRDESIRRELARFGRAGVPLYVVYDPESPDAPRVLSELLTVDGLLEALRSKGGRGA